MTGRILSTRHRYVTDLVVSSDSVGNGHFSDYHRFFSLAAWVIDEPVSSLRDCRLFRVAIVSDGDCFGWRLFRMAISCCPG